MSPDSFRFIKNWLRCWQNWFCAIGLFALIVIGCRLWPHPPLVNSLPQSSIFYDRHGQLLRLTLAKDDRYRLWVPLENIAPTLIEAVLLHEDHWFYWHPGVNPYGLIRGAWMTYIVHGNRQGGSTITMQLARLLYQQDTRTPWRKLCQIAYAIQLELFYSKKDILEAYLNFAPYGGNVEGIQTASLIYFNKKSTDLNLPEALTLAVIPQEPNLRLRRQKNGSFWVTNNHLLKTKAQLYQIWQNDHPQSEQQKVLFNLPLSFRPVSHLPFEAPHFTNQLLVSNKKPNNFYTVLDLNIQHLLEQQIHEFIRQYNYRGYDNAAALLIDTNNMAVTAMVGSANFFQNTIQGQINGTNVPRSPGSSLKPFVYAIGLDQGILHPQTILHDVPMTFQGYTPENFDSHFLGPLTATQALNKSRNIPAVWISSKLHNPDFYQFLKDADIGYLRKARHYGLTLVLGGGEITMQDMARLYAMLAYHGKIRPLRFLQSDPQPEGKTLLSDAASFITMDMLSQNYRPDNIGGGIYQPFPIAWKTGTSSGFHDAWTAGIFEHYVLIVWIGNFDNKANNNLIGVQAAAPLFFNIIDALKATQNLQKSTNWIPPKSIKKIEICLASGDLPNHWCPELGYTWFIPGVSPIRVSTLHQPVLIDDATGKAVCPPLEGKKFHTEIFEFWPSDLRSIFNQAGLYHRLPPSNYNCQKGWNNLSSPHIISPQRASSYTLRLSIKDQSHLALMANSNGSVQTLYWFADNNYLGSNNPTQPLFWQPKITGKYHLRVVDDHGKSSQRIMNIRIIP